MKNKKQFNPLHNLPIHSPSPIVWDKIEHQLNLPLNNLPQYNAPDHVWEAIQKQLNSKKPNLLWLKTMAAAACITILIGIGFSWGLESNIDKVIVKKNDIPKALLVANQVHFESLDLAQKKIYNLCPDRHPDCSDKDIKKIKDEIQKLNNVYAKLAKAIHKYNQDPQLIQKVRRIEKHKAEALKKLSKVILKTEAIL